MINIEVFSIKYEVLNANKVLKLFFRRYVDDTFLKTYVATVGIDFKIKTIQLSDLNIKLQIWDTEGKLARLLLNKNC